MAERPNSPKFENPEVVLTDVEEESQDQFLPPPGPNTRSKKKAAAVIVKPIVDLPTLLKFIKPYDGCREQLNSFLVNCNNAYELASESQKDILFKYILCQLQGKAETACSIKEFANWHQLKEFLKTQFSERKHYAHLLTELQNCKQQATEPVSQTHQRGISSRSNRRIRHRRFLLKKRVAVSSQCRAGPQDFKTDTANSLRESNKIPKTNSISKPELLQASLHDRPAKSSVSVQQPSKVDLPKSSKSTVSVQQPSKVDLPKSTVSVQQPSKVDLPKSTVSVQQPSKVDLPKSTVSVQQPSKVDLPKSTVSVQQPSKVDLPNPAKSNIFEIINNPAKTLLPHILVKSSVSSIPLSLLVDSGSSKKSYSFSYVPSTPTFSIFPEKA
ncbi:hypothetical protein ABMA27_007799 [Loxostege sticticalis]|uniref:Uncharacterized protein n=1 Tax=Loxostege sticticalis TaxID=481309 RepID=A0ABR3HCW4_LOXSC